MVDRADWPQILMMLMILLSASLSMVHAANKADNDFVVSVDKYKVEYGKSVVLTIRGKQSDTNLASISLSALEDDFAIEPMNSQADTKTDAPVRQWRLYPRRSGELSIPVLHYASQKSEPLVLEVTPAMDPRDGQPIRVTTEISETDVWLRQAVHLRMQLETASPIIVLQRDEPIHDALDIRELETTGQPVDGARQHYRHTTGWVAHPLLKGKQQLQLPPLDYVRDGVTTHRFYPPVLRLEVRPLPPYLSPQIPVGKLSLQLDRPDRFVFTGELRHLNVTLQGQGIRRQDMPQLERQLSSSAGITLYPAQQERQENTEKGRLISQSEYAIPISLKQSGRLTLPDFRLDYFDPGTGRITSLKIEGEAVYAINRWLFYILIGILLLVLWIGVRKSLPALTRYMRRLRGYIRVLSLLPAADSDQRVVKLLRELAVSEGWLANLTLVHWLQCWQNRYVPDPRIDQAIEGLMLKRYAGQPLDIRPIREQLHAALARQHIIARWIARFTPINA